MLHVKIDPVSSGLSISRMFPLLVSKRESGPQTIIDCLSPVRVSVKKSVVISPVLPRLSSLLDSVDEQITESKVRECGLTRHT